MSASRYFLFFLSSFFAFPPSFPNSASDNTSIRTFNLEKISAQATFGSNRKLSTPLKGDDGRVYACSGTNLFAFESNGSFAWSLNLNYNCNMTKSPIQGSTGKLYLIAENRLLKINTLNIGTPGSVIEVFFGPGPGQPATEEIIGVSVSTISSSIFITIKNRALFAYTANGQLIWSAGPLINQYGYQQGCRKGDKDCFFASSPVLDQCEGSIYILNTQGELYSLSIRSPYFKWIQDFSSYNDLSVTPGNNGLLYVTVPVKSMILALDVSSGNVIWQRYIGPLRSASIEPVVDSHGWISIGSLDGFLYSFSPAGILKKFPRGTRSINSVIQVSPFLDCSGYGVYVCNTEMEGKTSHTIGDYTYVSALKPKSAVFTLIVPATGKVYWSERHTGQFSTLLSKSPLKDFVVDEGILLAFMSASNIGNPSPCRGAGEKLASTCSQGSPKHTNIHTGNGREIIFFLFFESLLLIILAALVRFCWLFWRKRELKHRPLGSFLEKRRSLQLKKKAFDRTISELKQKAAEEAAANELIEEIGSLVRERDGIEKKLSTTYSLGRDKTRSKPKPSLPLYNPRNRSYSFQGPRKESVTIFHTLSDPSYTESSSSSYEEGFTSVSEFEDDRVLVLPNVKGKAKAETSDIGEESSSDDEIRGRCYRTNPSEPTSGFVGSLSVEQGPKEEVKSLPTSSRNIWLKRRTLSLSN